MKKVKVKFPPEVKDKKAYLKMLALQTNPVIKNQIRDATDGTEINLGWMPHLLKKKIEHLSKTEQERFLGLKDTFFKINNQLTAAKRQALGLPQGRQKTINSLDNTILQSKTNDLLEYFGRMFNVDEVFKIIKKEWPIPVSKKLLYDFYRAHAKEIKELQDKHQNQYHNLRLGIKKSRLEELSEIYNKQKENWEDANKREDLKVLLGILEQLRKEAEGDRLTIDGKVDISYEQNINLHLMKEVFSTTNLKEIILGRVAAKMGINPIRLIYSLNNSHYKAFSNVLGDFDPEDDTELVYPSQMNYDFEKINRLYNKKEMDAEDAIIVEERNDKNNLDKGKALKDILMKKLSEKNQKVNETKTKLDLYEQEKQSKAKDDKAKKRKL